MRPHRSIAEIVDSLERQVAFYREREAFHAQQEAYQREQRSAYAAELETVTRHLEAFRAAAEAAVPLADRAVTPVAPAPEEDFGSASRPKLGRMVGKVLADLGKHQPFGLTLVTAEVNRRFGERLRRPVDERQVSVVLRRLQRAGKLHLVRRGRPHWEALYSRERPPEG